MTSVSSGSGSVLFVGATMGTSTGAVSASGSGGSSISESVESGGVSESVEFDCTSVEV